MKKTFVRFAFAMMALVSGTQLIAESHGLIRVSVPFEFSVAGTKMPAGDYSISENGDGGTLLIHCLTSKRSVLVLSGPGTAPAGNHNAGLTFERQNGTPVLTRVMTDSTIARSLPSSH